MIVTRSWLNEFINLGGVTNERLYTTFNSIGLEVDSIKSYDIPQKVVVGKVLSCQKHPDADKLNVCEVDVGDGVKQIVCGAANVVDAEYVAVALVGAKLPGDLEIKFATLRGVESEGMICSTSELGLPGMGSGIMMLDESIGKLEIGKELRNYETIADTLIELELTANRGDCLSIYGVARDLSVALDLDIAPFSHQSKRGEKIGIARMAELHSKGEMSADLLYALMTTDRIDLPFLIGLRLAMIEAEAEETIEKLLTYATHTTGVILRAYDAESLKHDDKISLNVLSQEDGIVILSAGERNLGSVGIAQNATTKPSAQNRLILLEASYIPPDLLVASVAGKSIEKDTLYYRTSRGSEPNISFGMEYLASLLENDAALFYDGSLGVSANHKRESLIVDCEEIHSLIGQVIENGRVIGILKSLGFEIQSSQSERFGVRIPQFRHDVKNIQDLTEEIVRIVGINNIQAKPLEFVESNRLGETTPYYAFKRGLRERAVGCGFFENVSYLFCEKRKLDEYGFDLLDPSADLTNPIVEELNTLRSTIAVNLLEALGRNIKYGAKSVALFEIGAVVDTDRREKEVLTLIFSGQEALEGVANSGKPAMIHFASFAEKIGLIIGDFTLQECTYSNKLLHPYQSADLYCRGKRCGFVSKLHPLVQEAYGANDTFIAELDMGALIPVHKNAKPISKFQGVYKDLSLVVEKDVAYSKVESEISSLGIDILQKWYPIDLYTDEALGEKKSLTVRFFIQSLEKTLEESDIEYVMSAIMKRLEMSCQAALR